MNDFDYENILGLPKKDFLEFIGIEDDSEESIINALLNQIDRLVNYVIRRLLDDSKHPIRNIGGYFPVDSFGSCMYHIFNEDYFTIKELFMDDIATLLIKFLTRAKEYIDSEGKKSSLYFYISFEDSEKELMEFILEIKDVLADIIYFDICADYDFDTRENPDSDILFNIQSLAFIADCDDFTELWVRYNHIILEYFKKIYSMENKLKLDESNINDDREFVKYKLMQHRLDIVELILYALRMSKTDFS